MYPGRGGTGNIPANNRFQYINILLVFCERVVLSSSEDGYNSAHHGHEYLSGYLSVYFPGLGNME